MNHEEREARYILKYNIVSISYAKTSNRSLHVCLFAKLAV